ncbi:hypothetical protein PAXRUDRAFT_832412 [Paxillus rubicundulus Ve08.2h10]|uniref:Unplaced genomic scaffold scaffold_857, whole genome shotgun sequence n=1 Tax=Paxillus rubicundulus Ve08.2h10 TaxID=930991 RepID=A0A0D0D210_9AGAM|nr:hypothetical protein PAXRUDRAFT_832412 [Paxillus rubicundulus Ve08.2h10]
MSSELMSAPPKRCLRPPRNPPRNAPNSLGDQDEEIFRQMAKFRQESSDLIRASN